jgi:hypothetical protein
MREILRISLAKDFRNLQGKFMRFIYLAGLLCLLVGNGCVPALSGLIAYQSAVNHQETAAYGEYLVGFQMKSTHGEQAGNEQPLDRETWLRDIYRPKGLYAEYIEEQRKQSKTPVSYDDWVRVEYPKILKAKTEKPVPQHPH